MRQLAKRFLWLSLAAAAMLCSASAASAAARSYRLSAKANARKFKRVEHFSNELPKMRAEVKETLDHPQRDEKTAVAAIVRIMDKTYMRVGSERYAQRERQAKRKNRPEQEPSYGASSLRKEHVKIKGDTVRFEFAGKSHVRWDTEPTKDAKLVGALKLFLKKKAKADRVFTTTEADGEVKDVTERNVREYFGEHGAQPKDMRTLHANELRRAELEKLPEPRSKREAERNLDTAIQNVAAKLHHTPAIDRASYQNGAELKAYVAAAE
jgi:DNA topoisomerase-1